MNSLFHSCVYVHLSLETAMPTPNECKKTHLRINPREKVKYEKLTFN